LSPGGKRKLEKRGDDELTSRRLRKKEVRGKKTTKGELKKEGSNLLSTQGGRKRGQKEWRGRVRSKLEKVRKEQPSNLALVLPGKKQNNPD